MRGLSVVSTGGWTLGVSLFLCGCSTGTTSSSVPPDEAHAARSAERARSPLDLLDELEGDIDAGRDTRAQRTNLHVRVATMEDDGSVEYAYARAHLAARSAEGRGLGALPQVKEAARYARKVLERDSEFREGGARRMLGTIYVLAGRHLNDADSEQGLELLEEQWERYPAAPANALRLAEAFVALGDPDPAFDLLCEVQAAQESLRPEEGKILASLREELGGDLGC